MILRAKPLALIAIASLALSLAAAYDPPSGAETAASLASPALLAGGYSAASTESPMADLANPAASAAQQRLTLDLSYGALVGLADDTGWGSALNLGIAVPRAYGVWTGYLGLLSSPFGSMPLGTVVTGRVGLAKDLYPDLLLGLAVDTRLGSNGGFGWGLAADLGVIGLAGDVGALKNLVWGASLRNMGKAFEAPGAVGLSGGLASAYDAPFTPQVGASADLIRADKAGLKLSANADLWLPTFQNAVFATGLRLGWRDRAFLRLGWDFNLREAIAGVDQGLLPSFGLGASFAIDRESDDSLLSKAGLDRSEIRPSFSAAELYGGVWAFSGGANVPVGVLDRVPPRITVSYPAVEHDAYYISPNSDGARDLLTLPLSITDQRYVQSFSLKVLDESGAVVKTMANKESRPENQDLKGLLGRLLYVKKGVDVPAELEWNGLTDSGAAAPDGRYFVVIEAVDDNGNVASTERWPVVIDTVPPSVKASGPAGDALIFSPDGDGSKDEFAIAQEGSVEDSWVAVVTDAAGATVRSWTTASAAPSALRWDGKNDSGKVVPDGVYSYRVAAVDRAGNQGSARIDNIIVNTQQPPVGVSIDLAAFSPDGDGVKDSLTLTPNVPVKAGLASWRLAVLDDKGVERWAASGVGADSIEPAYRFSGKDASGAALPEGTYRTRLSVSYVNGHGPVAHSPNFVIDVTPPAASVSVGRAAFNPLGDADATLTLSQAGSTEERWAGELLDASGAPVKTWIFIGKPDPTVIWDGSDDAGKVVPDGSYAYRLSATDKAGNSGSATGPAIVVDTQNKAVRLSLDRRAFSPNGDGVADTVAMVPESQSATAVQSWSLTVVDAADAKVRGYSGSGSLPARLSWDGRRDDGSKAPDGIYRAALEVRFVTAEVESARSVDLALDVTPPAIELSAAETLFSPNGDGRKDVLSIRQTSTPGDTWEGAILDSAGRVMRAWTWKDAAVDFDWDGADSEGNKVADGAYRYVVRSEDPAGNKTEKAIQRMVVDTRQTQAFVTASAAGFSPNGDGMFDEMSFGLVVKLTDGIDSWKLAMVGDDGVTRRSFTGKGATIPAKLAWDGKSDDGQLRQGAYTAVFTVDYLKGDRAQASSATFSLDTEGPKVAMTTSPRYFSPDNDGVDDELRISLAVSDASVIDSWRFDIVEVAVSESAGAKRAERVFFSWSGRGKPAERLAWDGRSQKGELVEAATDYPYRLTIVDELGNQTVSEGLISVDVLVIRDGDRLKIKVPSIVFRPDFADFKDLPQETLDRNAEVLKRIAQILNRFKDYKIRVEGHANSIAKMTGAGQPAIDREETRELLPLSENRAALVMQKLIEYGVDPKRLSVRGLGSSEPVVPFTDAENRWKNRRVEFILIKE
ncbi:MAG TPA: gliding motility-associated C-terminal domain-containing protein [Spirochaetales bacterium]|nr:gliding motility-associated C-terminal domain-containing protein [Spirochaetales bacterium]